MLPEINLDDPAAARVIGRRRVASALKVRPGEIEDAKAWSKAFPTHFIPKGLYRFKSHEEADEWTWKMITRPRN